MLLYLLGEDYYRDVFVLFEDVGFTFKDMIAWNKEKAPHRAQRISVVYEKRGDVLNAKKWSGWRIGNLRPIFEPILWFYKPYKMGGTITDNMLEHEVGAFNEDNFLKYTSSPDNYISMSATKNDTGLHSNSKTIKTNGCFN